MFEKFEALKRFKSAKIFQIDDMKSGVIGCGYI